MKREDSVQGIVNIYKSSPYPIRVEMIFINDSNGSNFREIINNWLNEKNIAIEFKDKHSDLTISVDMYFPNQGLFVIVINSLFENYTFYDEREKGIIKKQSLVSEAKKLFIACLLYTSPSPRDRQKSRMPSSA